jgi:hypothetical protein
VVPQVDAREEVAESVRRSLTNDSRRRGAPRWVQTGALCKNSLHHCQEVGGDAGLAGYGRGGKLHCPCPQVPSQLLATLKRMVQTRRLQIPTYNPPLPEHMTVISEFKSFIAKGNVMDLAVGVIIGGAFPADIVLLTEIRDLLKK